ncbi:MAG: prephenate dehydrogenase [Candidatus Avispirillum sp.]
MKLIRNRTFLIVGLGLIGGSYAKALHRNGFRVTAITKEQADIDYAVEMGYIDEGSTEVDPRLVGEADITVFALYPHIFKEWIRDYQQYFKSGSYITDVTGVKSAVVYEIQDMLRDDVEFIAAHPMAGKECSGVQNSDDSIFRDANYIVVPTEKNTPEAIEMCESLGSVLGFWRVGVLSPEEHDEMIGFLSQLTHCIAISLMNCNRNDDLSKYTGDSFRDLTRIAKINDELWSELFLLNKKPLLKEMQAFEEELKSLREAIEREDTDTIRAKMRLSTERRKIFDKK